MSFCIGWEGCGSAQLELFSPGGESGDTYRLRYTAPFRTTIRPPLEPLTLGAEELQPVRDKLNGLLTARPARGTRRAPDAVAQPQDDLKQDDNVLLEKMKLLGCQLLDLIVPQAVQTELRASGVFLEMGIDEKLLEYPWELMHDGDEFLCLKHLVGRFVNVINPTIPRLRPVEPLAGPLSILLISVPQPQPRGGVEYEPLAAAESETAAIVDALTPLGKAVDIKLLKGPTARWDDVYKAIKGGRYHIVHFNGHAYFNTAKPHLSSLVLFDRNLTTGPIVSFFGSRPPVLFFMNACETAAADAPDASWEQRYDIFGLARAFLESGGYLVGSRWKVGDDGAAAFARKFYTGVIDGLPLGQVIRDARLACRDASEDEDLSWASYLFYGDPRLRFFRDQVVTP